MRSLFSSYNVIKLLFHSQLWQKSSTCGFLDIFYVDVDYIRDFLENVRLKGGINLNAIFPPLDMALMEISRSRFKQSKNSMLIP